MIRTSVVGVAVAIAFSFLAGVALADTKPPGPLGLPSVQVLKDKLSLSATQTKQVETIYDEYKDKAKEVEQQGDAQKKAEVRHEIVGKIKEICTTDQKQMLDQIVTEKSKN